MAATDRHDGDWASLIGNSDERPPGWKTIPEVAAETNMNVYTVRDRMKRLLREGKVESRVFSVRCGERQSLTNVTCFKPVIETKRKQ